MFRLCFFRRGVLAPKLCHTLIEQPMRIHEPQKEGFSCRARAYRLTDALLGVVRLRAPQAEVIPRFNRGIIALRYIPRPPAARNTEQKEKCQDGQKRPDCTLGTCDLSSFQLRSAIIGSLHWLRSGRGRRDFPYVDGPLLARCFAVV